MQELPRPIIGGVLVCLKGNVNLPFPMLLIFESYVDGGFEKAVNTLIFQPVLKRTRQGNYTLIVY